MKWAIGDFILLGVGFVSYPVLTRYLLIPVGETMWDDIKNIGYAVWEKAKALVGRK